MKPEYLVIHQVLHDTAFNAVDIGGTQYPVQLSRSNGCRYIDYDGIRFMEQNKTKNSTDAKRAREGAKITWGIKDGKWLRIA